jgi:hypothetical protein
MASTPFDVGDRVLPEELVGWTFTGLSGKPGKDSNAVRRFTRGDWVLEIRALEQRKRRTTVVAIRTRAQDEEWWRDQRHTQDQRKKKRRG